MLQKECPFLGLPPRTGMLEAWQMVSCCSRHQVLVGSLKSILLWGTMEAEQETKEKSSNASHYQEKATVYNLINIHKL